jgi:hypothetical protein
LSELFFLVGAALFALLGVGHGVLTLRDLRAPRSFTPIDDSLRRAMAEAPLRFAPQTTMWKAWLGFNLSHSLGLVIFGTFLGALAFRDFGVVAESVFLQSGAVIAGLIYVVLAVRFWFWAPAVLSGVGTLCFVVSALSG